MALWLKQTELDHDVVISTRVRLARNIKGLPFPHIICGTARAQEVVDTAQRAFLQEGSDFRLVRMSELSALDKQRMVEAHLISYDLAKHADGAAILSPDERICVMLLEEDHFRIQCLTSGLDPDTALATVRALDQMLNAQTTYAFDEELGFLTSCPTNVGTGMRLSAMLHLPALTKAGAIGSVLGGLSKLGVAVRGIYGEGSSVKGAVYQVSNQVTLGIAEEDIVKNLKTVIREIVGRERELRRKLYEAQPVDVEDMVMRSYGAMKYARKMDASELLEHIANVNMGISLGLVTGLTSNRLYNTMIDAMPATVAEAGAQPDERDAKRAVLVRNMMQEV